MKLRIAVFALLCALACRARPLTSDAGGSGTITGAGGAGPDTGGAGTDDGVAGTDTNVAGDADFSGVDARRDPVAVDAAEYLACVSDGDCVATAYTQPVTSVADCYCVICTLLPVNQATHLNFAAQWTQHCAGWQPPAGCPTIPCPARPAIKCVAGQCRAGSYIVPSACPVDPNSGCANAISCRGTCCQAGEWCDEEIGCRCGSRLACPVGQTCGHTYAGNDGRGFCGDTCCFDCRP
jgi:hypothetical protein